MADIVISDEMLEQGARIVDKFRFLNMDRLSLAREIFEAMTRAHEAPQETTALEAARRLAKILSASVDPPTCSTKVITGGIKGYPGGITWIDTEYDETAAVDKAYVKAFASQAVRPDGAPWFHAPTAVDVTPAIGKRIAEISKIMNNKDGPYWKGPTAASMQKEFGDLLYVERGLEPPDSQATRDLANALSKTTTWNGTGFERK